MHDFPEFRQLTVLFCDIVDSTGLSVRCDAEDLREVLNEFQSISTRCIKDAGGTVLNYIGDGIRCAFGYPQASENEAEAAVRAGLMLLEAIERLEDWCIATIHEPLRVRIGVHTGKAVIGKGGVGHVHDATEIVGETPNIAFRLQEIGVPNSLVISSETERLLKGKFQLRWLGEHNLKGLARQVSAFQVLGEESDGNVARGDNQRDVLPLVGRGREIDQLLQLWEAAKAGRGQSVQITGEAGIGKSRLALEVIRLTGLGEEAIVTLQSSAQHQNTPLYPIIRRLEQQTGIRKGASSEAKLALLNETLGATPADDNEQVQLIGRLLGLAVPRPASSPVPDAQELRRKTRDAVVALLTARARAGAGVILVEDLHWADPSTIEVVERIAGTVASSRALLIITSRTESQRSGPAAIRGMGLQRLADQDCRALADAAVRGGRLTSQLVEQILRRSDGVPLFVEELTAAAIETGQVDPGAGARAASGEHDVPSALYDSLMLRLERLGEAKSIAQLAAVIGRTFSHQLLALVATEDAIALEAPLARLLESGLIQREDNAEKTYSFKHALVRDVAYHSLLKRRRRVLHARVADKIEVHLPEIANREPEYFAQHLSEAGRSASAVRMRLKAAQQSAARSANLEALAQLRAALEQIAKVPTGAERDDLELSVQVALIAPTIAVDGFSAPSVADVSARAIDLCRALNEDPRIFPALYARWSNLRVAGKVQEAGVLANDFMRLAEQKGTRTDRMVGHRLVGTALIDWDTARACEELEKASAFYDHSRDHNTALVYATDVQVTTLSNLAIAYWLLGRVTHAVERSRSALGLATQLQHAFTFGYAIAHACQLHTLERDIPTVKSLAQQMLDAATKRELPLWMSVSRAFLGWCELEAGRVPEGMRILEGERNFLRVAHVSYWLPMYLSWLAEAYADTGDMARAKASLDEARAIIGGANFWYEIECLRIEARMTGNEAQAEQLFGQALELARQRGQTGFALRAAHGFAQHLVRKGETAHARALLQEALLPFVDQPDSGDRREAKSLLRSLESYS
jgi:class 3 adenylate cyclase/tetratricopeptide (TPR) repeat protein